MKEAFYNDLARLYALLKERDEHINNLYHTLVQSIKGGKYAPELAPLRELLSSLNLKESPEYLLALAARLVNLQEGALILLLKQEGKEAQLVEIKRKVLHFVEDFHMRAHEEVLRKMEDEELLTPFYRALLRGIHHTGIAMNRLYESWQFGLIDGINAELLREFHGDMGRILEVLQSAQEVSETGEVGDRSYSIPSRDGAGEFCALPYAKAFSNEITRISKELLRLIRELENEGDPLFQAKDAYVNYFNALRSAFLEGDSRRLLERWRAVDRAWMEIKMPLQPAHPLEYYEDRFRKAVAPEWDLRLSLPKNSATIPIKEQMKECFKHLLDELDPKGHYEKLRQICLSSCERTQLYIGIPAFYYGAELGGLFSAQVVPNDECVSKALGKKIFAFPERVLESARHKPFMKLASEIFPREFLQESREILYFHAPLWHRVYEICTIGHEFGHIFFIDEDTENAMNAKGQFKNIEEFKATSGGLMNFFLHEDSSLIRALLIDHIKRAVGLIAWMEQDEVMPYYCEGLMHLGILFDSGVLAFSGGCLDVDLGAEAYGRLKSLYTARYNELAEHYLQKREAGLFLERFLYLDENRRYKPKEERCRAFVEHYWRRYQEVGQLIDEEQSSMEWLRASQNKVG